MLFILNAHKTRRRRAGRGPGMSTTEIVTHLAARCGKNAVREAVRLETEARRRGGFVAGQPYVAAAILLCYRR